MSPKTNMGEGGWIAQKAHVYFINKKLFYFKQQHPTLLCGATIIHKKKLKVQIFFPRHSKIYGLIDFSRNITKSVTLILNFFMKSALSSGLLDKLYLYGFFDNYFVPFALYFRKIIKKSKEYQRF